MEFKDLVDSYLSFLKDNFYSDRTVLRYDYLIGAFNDFLNINKINSNTLESYLNGIDPKNILESAELYIQNGAISEDTISMYISIVKEFFKYIKKQFNIGNDDLIKSFGLGHRDENSFSYKVRSFVTHKKEAKEIKVSTDGPPITDEQVRIIKSICDSNIATIDVNLLNEKGYNLFIKSLAVKLIVFLGLSIERINDIKIEDLDFHNGTIIINEYRIHLPYWLRQQLSVFYNIKLKQKDISGNRRLLTLYNGSMIAQPAVLGAYINRMLRDEDVQKPYSTISLAKYAIIQMIDAGLDRDTIIEITGYKNYVYDRCKDIILKVNMDKRIDKVDKIIKQLPSFDLL